MLPHINISEPTAATARPQPEAMLWPPHAAQRAGNHGVALNLRHGLMDEDEQGGHVYMLLSSLL